MRRMIFQHFLLHERITQMDLLTRETYHDKCLIDITLDLSRVAALIIAAAQLTQGQPQCYEVEVEFMHKKYILTVENLNKLNKYNYYILEFNR